MLKPSRPRAKLLVTLVLASIAASLTAGGAPPRLRPLLLQGRPGVYERWAEVVTVTPKWLVLQDEEGKQYPVALDAVGMFLCRWPTTLDRLGPGTLVEATGVDADSNRLLTDHLDVYEGGARNMVSPGLIFISGSGRGYRPIDFTFNAEAYGDPFPGLGTPIQGGVSTGPAQVHIVGPVIRRNPLMIAWEGNNAMTIISGPAGISMSQITQGTLTDLRRGDLVYFAAIEARPKSLVLEQLVAFKSVPYDQFAR